MVPKGQDFVADALGKAQACLYLTGASCQELKAKQAKYSAHHPSAREGENRIVSFETSLGRRVKNPGSKYKQPSGNMRENGGSSPNVLSCPTAAQSN